MTRSENFILDFTHIYVDENIEQTENIVRIDCSDILGTDLYCTKEGEAEIQKRIENFSINGVHFIDSGQFHKLIISRQIILFQHFFHNIRLKHFYFVLVGNSKIRI